MDKTRWPISELVVRHWQDYDQNIWHDGLLAYRIEDLRGTPALDLVKQWRAGSPDPEKDFYDPATDKYDPLQDYDVVTNGIIRFDKGMIVNQFIEFDNSDHDIYWSVAWRNLHDPAVYYLVSDPSLWQELIDDTIHGITIAFGYTVDVCTESPAGTAMATAANAFESDLLKQGKVSAKIENKINTDDGKQYLIITLNCDRRTAYLYSPGHTTDCSVKFYLKGSPSQASCGQAPTLE
jgi:hypothetical protein